MLVSELEKSGCLPELAGLAKLKFERIDYTATSWKGLKCHEPSRSGDSIVITYNETTKYYPLLNGRQFVVTTRYNTLNARAYFGGTDEQPFLTKIDHWTAHNVLEMGNEEDFFAKLKPVKIALQEEIVGKDVTKRQGDIFAIQAPFNWDEFDVTGRFMIYEPVKTVVAKSLFGTRHTITGKVWGEYWEDRYKRPIVLFEGTILAPDHTSLILSSIHSLAQAEYILDPEEAD